MNDIYPEVPGHVAGCDTSEAAADSVASTAGAMRTRVYELIKGRGGLTCDQVEERTGMRHQTASARIRELVLGGHLVDSALRRETRSGRTAKVWVLA